MPPIALSDKTAKQRLREVTLNVVYPRRRLALIQPSLLGGGAAARCSLARAFFGVWIESPVEGSTTAWELV
jgi:hypothetical protein